MRKINSPYMEWAKLCSGAEYFLAGSAVENYSIKDLPITIDDIELTGPSTYGYQPLQTAIAKKCQVTEENVVAAIGTSMANHLVMATLLTPGDEVLMEAPAYEPLLTLAEYFGVKVNRFNRDFSQQFRVDPTAVAAGMTPRTKLIVLTNLHNPSAVMIDEQTLIAVGEIAAKHNCHLLVDEVYLEALYDDRPQSAIHLGPQFIVTSSLTKAFGLGGLRCGWILAEPTLAKQIWRLNDIFAGIPSHAAERLSVIVFQHLDQISARAKSILDTNRQLVKDFLATRNDLSTVVPPYGAMVFPKLLTGDVDELCRLLREKYQTSVVPGRFFEMPNHFRLGIGSNTVSFTKGLERLAAALDELKQR